MLLYSANPPSVSWLAGLIVNIFACLLIKMSRYQYFCLVVRCLLPVCFIYFSLFVCHSRSLLVNCFAPMDTLSLFYLNKCSQIKDECRIILLLCAHGLWILNMAGARRTDYMECRWYWLCGSEYLLAQWSSTTLSVEYPWTIFSPNFHMSVYLPFPSVLQFIYLSFSVLSSRHRPSSFASQGTIYPPL